MENNNEVPLSKPVKVRGLAEPKAEGKGDRYFRQRWLFGRLGWKWDSPPKFTGGFARCVVLLDENGRAVLHALEKRNWKVKELKDAAAKLSVAAARKVACQVMGWPWPEDERNERQLAREKLLQDYARTVEVPPDVREYEYTPKIIPHERDVKVENGKTYIITEEIARLDAEATAASQQCAALRNLAENCERYLRDAGAIAFHTGTVSLNRGDTLESIRKEIATLKADRHEIESQCLDAKTATAIAFREIDRLAEKGRPDLGALLGYGQGIVWPSRQEMVALVAAQEVVSTKVDETYPALAWLFRDQMKAAVEAQIKRESEGGLSPDQREAALSKVAAALLSAERRELVLLLADESLAPRADMDPRAAMSLSSTMPEAA